MGEEEEKSGQEISNSLSYLRGIERNLDWLHSKEQISKFPKMKFNIVSAPHAKPEDLKIIEGLISETDIYIPELVNWGKDSLEVYQKVADGEMTPEEAAALVKVNKKASSYEYRLSEFQLIYGSKIKVIFLDLDVEQMKGLKPLLRDILEYTPINEGETKDFETLLGLQKEYLEREAEFHNIREEVILTNLQKQLTGLLEQNPGLKKRPELRILVRMGRGHSKFYHELVRAGLNAIRHYSEEKIYDFESEGIRRLMFGKPIDNEFVAKVLLQTLLIKAFTNNSVQLNTSTPELIRNVISKFSISEIRDICNKVSPFSNLVFRQEFLSLLKQKGFNIP